MSTPLLNKGVTVTRLSNSRGQIGLALWQWNSSSGLSNTPALPICKMQALSGTRRTGGVFSAAPQRQHSARRAVRVNSEKKKQLMMWEALREAVDEEMERDPTVCVMGGLLLFRPC